MKKIWLLSVSIPFLLFSCKKEEEQRVQLYPDGPKAEIKFLDGLPSPSQGRTGAPVTFKVTGLKGKTGFQFLMGQLPAEIIEVKDSSVTIRIPEDAITGGAAVLYNDQYFFGPQFRVSGKLQIDPSFTAFNGSNGRIYDIMPVSGLANTYVIAGSFSDYMNSATPANGIFDMARVDKSGMPLVASGNRMFTRTGTEGGSINSLATLASGNYLVSGFFTKFNERSGISSLTRMNQRAQLDTTVVNLVNPDPIGRPQDDKDTVATFNGGVNGTLFYSFETSSGQIISVGNFTEYRSVFYTRSTKSGKISDRVLMNQVLRMNANGSLDSSFNYNLTLHRGNPGGNGPLTGAIRISGGRLLLVGAFTTYNGTPAGRIVCINETDGSINTTFNAGAGASDVISSITFNATTGKIMLTGSFKNFNGTPVNGVVMLNQNGSVDPTFTLRTLEGGNVTYAAQLNSGKVIIAGSFQKYDNKIRPGFAYLDANGVASAGYNNTGAFTGRIYKMIEITTEQGLPGLILVGDFTKFDNQNVNDIIYLEIRN